MRYTPVRPPVLANRLITGLASFGNEALCKNIFTPSEQTPEDAQTALD
jgi:hypothetical protein